MRKWTSVSKALPYGIDRHWELKSLNYQPCNGFDRNLSRAEKIDDRAQKVDEFAALELVAKLFRGRGYAVGILEEQYRILVTVNWLNNDNLSTAWSKLHVRPAVSHPVTYWILHTA